MKLSTKPWLELAIDTRYLGSFGFLLTGFPTKEQAREILKIAEKVYRATLANLKSGEDNHGPHQSGTLG